MGERSDRGRGARGVIRGIDQELDRVDRQLSGYEELLAERRRLLAARRALAPEAPGVVSSEHPRISQDDVAAYLADHPGALPAEIAAALGVPVTNVSAHLFRGKGSRFLRGGSGWELDRHAYERSKTPT
jgi:hypothetical protein